MAAAAALEPFRRRASHSNLTGGDPNARLESSYTCVTAMDALAGCNTISGSGQGHQVRRPGDRESRTAASKKGGIRIASHGAFHTFDGYWGADGPGQRRHRCHHPKQFLKSMEQRLRPEPVRCLALLDPASRARTRRRASPIPTSCWRVTRREHPAARRENFGCGSFARTRAWALQQYGFKLRDRAELRRHLLQQLLQERAAADRGCLRSWRPAVRRVATFPDTGCASTSRRRP